MGFTGCRLQGLGVLFQKKRRELGIAAGVRYVQWVVLLVFVALLLGFGVGGFRAWNGKLPSLTAKQTATGLDSGLLKSLLRPCSTME